MVPGHVDVREKKECLKTCLRDIRMTRRLTTDRAINCTRMGSRSLQLIARRIDNQRPVGCGAYMQRDMYRTSPTSVDPAYAM